MQTTKMILPADMSSFSAGGVELEVSTLPIGGVVDVPEEFVVTAAAFGLTDFDTEIARLEADAARAEAAAATLAVVKAGKTKAAS